MANPPPTESALLQRYLLTPTLPEVVPFAQFAAFFPPSASRGQVRTLYLDLQRQRAAQLERAAREIEAEARRSRDARREVRASRLEREAEEADEEIEIERAVRLSLSPGQLLDMSRC